MKTSIKIKKYLKEKNRVTGSELSNYLGIGNRAVRKQLANLLRNGEIDKIGRPPKVFYLLKSSVEEKEDVVINKKRKEIIEKNYLIITPSGEKKDGFAGFNYWCNKNNLDVSKTADEYIKVLNKYDKFKRGGLIDGLQKFNSTFSRVYIDKIFYLDFYSIERFGKTRLGQLLLYGKQSGNKVIIKQIVAEIKPKIDSLIKKFRIDAVGFIPWTVKREVQFIRELEKQLNLNVKSIKIEKIKTEIIVPQKTLSKLEDRIENAGKTLVLTESGKYNNLLLIDDAVGSGATLNQVAKQVKDKKIAKNVIGISITGSFKGFDVISEV
ncbi:HTH domain-containing protein [Patescibacteria group bacterium]|nr:HTH domain-containing protein [Patescibacteria group bacterium]